MFTDEEWAAAQADDIPTRNRIVLYYQNLVEIVARNLSSRLPSHVEYEDLLSDGQIGLIDAIRRFDPSRGYAFSTFAMPRIRGEILDVIRQGDWIPRSTRAKETAINRSAEFLEQDLGRMPTMSEVSEHSELSVPDIHKAQNSLHRGSLISVDLHLNTEEDFDVGDTLSNSPDLDVIDFVDSEVVADAISQLAAREALTIAMHYYLGMTLAQIGEHFLVTESRVCQIHTKALNAIRESMTAHAPL